MSIFTRYILPIIAILGILLGVVVVIVSMQKPPTPLISFPPPVSPYNHFVAGIGQVEAASENISIGAPFTEIVAHVYVEAGDKCKEGDPLFRLDTRAFESDLKETLANLEVAEANYRRQLDLPRLENIPPLVAAYEATKMEYEEEKQRFALYENVDNPKAISVESYTIRRYQELFAKYQMEEAKANLDLLLAGAWVRDLDIFRAEVHRAQAQVAIIRTNLERSIIQAPYDGEILIVNVHKGEIVQTAVLEQDLILFGVVEPAHLRVDIDEEDAWRVLRGAPGIAYVRGNSNIHVDLDYVRLEPFLIPKRVLTGDDTEKIDTRVLQVIYRFNIGDLPIYFGEVLDVFIEARPNLGEEEET